MNEMKRIEAAMVFLVKAFEGVKTDKPTVLHSIRVGLRLLEHGFQTDVVVAGLLHDVLEDTTYTLDDIAKTFGPGVAGLVEVNTKNSDIVEQHERREELIKRCCEASSDALAIKVTDIYDNFRYYKSINDEGLVAYCLELKGYVVKYSKDSNYSPYVTETLKLVVV